MTAACTRVFSRLLILLLDLKLASVMITTRAALRNQATKTVQETQSQQHNAGNTVSAYQQLQKRADSVCSVCAYLNSGVRMMVAQVIDVVQTTRLQLR
jgi:hypothetical protein